MSNPLSSSADYQSRFNSAFVWRLKQALWGTSICVEQAQLALFVVIDRRGGNLQQSS